MEWLQIGLTAWNSYLADWTGPIVTAFLAGSVAFLMAFKAHENIEELEERINRLERRKDK